MKSPLVTFLLFFFCIYSLKAQLKEFDISPLPKPEISLVQANTEFGEDALIIIYSSLTNLNFRSSMGMIDKQSYNQQSNRYEVLVRPIKQILLVYSNGFMEGTISTINPNAKDVFYFKVEEKKTTIINQTVPGKLTINSTPVGANISLNGIPISVKTPFTGDLNPGPTRIQLSKSKFQSIDTAINVQSSINEVFSINMMPSTLWLNIKSNPPSAKVELDGKIIGETPLSKELDFSDKSKQGERMLNLSLTNYADVNQTIQLYPSKEPLSINVDLKKLEGAFKIESTLEGAEVFIDGEYKGTSPLQGTLPVGSYQVELKMEDYVPISPKRLIVNTNSISSLYFILKYKYQEIDSLDLDLAKRKMVKDVSGNIYHIVEIGQQQWMLENLKVSKFSNGDTIEKISNHKDWSKLKSSGWCNYNNSSENDGIYGKLYNWYTISDPRNVCPIGWHVPKDTEWKILSDFIGGESVAGSKLKTTGNVSDGTGLWQSPNKSTSNETNFSALPGGLRDQYGVYLDVNKDGNWWSSTELSSNIALAFNLFYGHNILFKNKNSKQNGFSIRCIKD